MIDKSINEQATNFWTGKGFSVCCDDADCHYEAGQLEDESYWVHAEKHGYEIIINRTPIDEMVISTLENVLLDSPDDLPVSWSLIVNDEEVKKSAFLTPQQIAFWDEVAILYQTIPDWLIQPLDEALEAKVILEEECALPDFDEDWFIKPTSSCDTSLKDLCEELLSTSIGLDTETSGYTTYTYNRSPEVAPALTWNAAFDSIYLHFNPVDVGEFSTYQWGTEGKQIPDLQTSQVTNIQFIDELREEEAPPTDAPRSCDCAMQVLMSNGCQCGGC